MPPQIQVKLLTKLTSDFISNTIESFLWKHSPRNCKYCITTFMNEDCYDLKQLKRILTELPETVRSRLYSETYSKVKEHQQTVLWLEIQYYHTWLFESDALRVDYISQEDFGDWYFITKFAKNIHSINWNLHRTNMNSRFLSYMLNSMTNLQIVDFGKNLTEYVLEVVGMYCTQLRSISGVIDYHKPAEAIFLPLLFKDPETRKKKNVCCNTLESIIIHLRHSDFDFNEDDNYPDIDDNYNEYDGDTLPFIEILRIIIGNVPKLKTLAEEFTFDKVCKLLNEDGGPMVKIETGHCRNLTQQIVKMLPKYFPALNSLTIEGKTKSKDLSQLLNTFGGLRNLNLQNEGRTSAFFADNKSSCWPNIRTLTLGEDNCKLNITQFPNMFPNLESLTITSCKSIIWEEATFFSFLRNVSVCFSDDPSSTDFMWIGSFSDSVQELDIMCPYFVPETFILKTSKILSIFFPKLETLSIYVQNTDIEKLKDFIDTCPMLKKFKYCSDDCDTGLEDEINDFLEESNFDCSFECFLSN